MWTVAFGESTMSRTQVQLRYNRFKKGRKDVNDNATVMKMILDIRRVVHIVQLMPGNFYGCKDCSKIAKP